MFYDVLEKRGALAISVPKGHGRTHADTLRSFFEEREHKTDDEIIDEYSRRQHDRGLISGGVVGAGLGSGLVPLSIKAGLGGLGYELKGVDDIINKRGLRALSVGVGAVGGALLGSHFGKDRAYHVSEGALPYLRAEQEKRSNQWVSNPKFIHQDDKGNKRFDILSKWRKDDDPQGEKLHSYLQSRSLLPAGVVSSLGGLSYALNPKKGLSSRLIGGGVALGGAALARHGYNKYKDYERKQQAKKASLREDETWGDRVKSRSLLPAGVVSSLGGLSYALDPKEALRSRLIGGGVALGGAALARHGYNQYKAHERKHKPRISDDKNDPLLNEFSQHHRRLEGLGGSGGVLGNYNTRSASLSDADKKRLDELYMSRHGFIPSKKWEREEGRELARLKSLGQ